jgi:uncharacterized protein (DUF433 family)
MAAEMVDSIPLAKDESGIYRVGGTRVTLELIVRAFNSGATAEDIAQDYPTLQLSDIYQTIGYYLEHGPDLAPYFEQRTREERELLGAHRDEWSPRGLRERLLARRDSR